jgi:ABC-type Zn2+ transport system, periplasmic component/surface adhesin
MEETHSEHDHSEHAHENHEHHEHEGHDHHDHGEGGHHHHHHGNFKELFLKSLPLGIIIMVLSPMMGNYFTISVYLSIL